MVFSITAGAVGLFGRRTDGSLKAAFLFVAYRGFYWCYAGPMVYSITATQWVCLAGETSPFFFG
jgi:hypothetical protein